MMSKAIVEAHPQGAQQEPQREREDWGGQQTKAAGTAGDGSTLAFSIDQPSPASPSLTMPLFG